MDTVIVFCINLVYLFQGHLPQISLLWAKPPKPHFFIPSCKASFLKFRQIFLFSGYSPVYSHLSWRAIFQTGHHSSWVLPLLRKEKDFLLLSYRLYIWFYVIFRCLSLLYDRTTYFSYVQHSIHNNPGSFFEQNCCQTNCSQSYVWASNYFSINTIPCPCCSISLFLFFSESVLAFFKLCYWADFYCLPASCHLQIS